MRLVALPSLRRLATVATVLCTTLLGGGLVDSVHAKNRVTPGNFTGYGFDQCEAPSQAAMDRWLKASPYWAVGIYISGDSRGCVSQPNLDAAWVGEQLAKSWRLLPLTVGPQASCTTRERYLSQVRISPDSTRDYATARRQGRAEAAKTVRAAERLGIAQHSTLWYDLEAFAIDGTKCRESALSFLSAWTHKLHALKYESGVYSSAASGIKILDDARVEQRGRYSMPDSVWIADWNGRADLQSSYVRPGGWMPHDRIHQYTGGHEETHGGVTIPVDSNYMSLGRGSVAPKNPRSCGVHVSFRSYSRLERGDTGMRVEGLQCLLKHKAGYAGDITGTFGRPTQRAVKKYQGTLGMPRTGLVSMSMWTALLAQGSEPVLKYGSARQAVRRVQRSLNAAVDARLPVTGVYDGSTAAAARRYQRVVGIARTGVIGPSTWGRLMRGLR